MSRLKINSSNRNSTLIVSVLFGIAGLTLLVATYASTNTFSFEVEDSAGTNVTIETDSSASGGQFLKFGDGTASSLPPRGPSGTWPRAQDPNNPGTFVSEYHTPDYDTPATIVTNGSFSDLQSKLNSASSGDVIQHDGGLTGTLTGGNSSWNKNVLIRPSIGKRADFTANDFFHEADKVTIAGYYLDNARVRNVVRSGFAWCEGDHDSFIAADAGFADATDIFLWEVVYTSDFSEVDDGDYMNSRAVGGTLTRPTFYGLYAAGPIRAIGSSAHNDTFQSYASQGGEIRNLLHHSGIYFAAGDKALQGSNGMIDSMMVNSTVYEPSTSDTWLPYADGHDGLGHHTITGGFAENGTIRDSDIVGSFGFHVGNFIDSNFYGSTYSVDYEENVTTKTGNLEPNLLPADVTHEFLDSIWSE